MTPDDVRAAAEQLVDFHERFAPLFGKGQAQDHAYDYLKGLMVCPERKSVEPIALLVGHGDVSGLQKFVGAAPWAYDDVMADSAGRLFAERAGPLDGRLADRGGRGDRRVVLHQEGVALRRGVAMAVTTTAGSARRTTARSVSFLIGVTSAGTGPAPTTGCSCPKRAGSVRRRARRRSRREEAHIPRGHNLPHQAPDRS